MTAANADGFADAARGRRGSGGDRGRCCRRSGGVDRVPDDSWSWGAGRASTWRGSARPRSSQCARRPSGARSRRRTQPGRPANRRAAQLAALVDLSAVQIARSRARVARTWSTRTRDRKGTSTPNARWIRDRTPGLVAESRHAASTKDTEPTAGTRRASTAEASLTTLSIRHAQREPTMVEESSDRDSRAALYVGEGLASQNCSEHRIELDPEPLAAARRHGLVHGFAQIR